MVIIINGDDKDITLTKKIAKADMYVVNTEDDLPEVQPKDVVFAVREVTE